MSPRGDEDARFPGGSLACGECVGDREQTAGPDQFNREAPPSEITRFFHDWFAAVENGDPDGILALVDADFVIKWPGGQRISEREQLRAALAKLQQTVRQTVQWEVLEGQVEGDWAWARVNEKATHPPKSAGDPRVLEGSHLTILRKVSRRWLLPRDQCSLNKLPGTPR